MILGNEWEKFRPPYVGQGVSLSSALHINGQWIIENYIFLFIPPPSILVTQISVPTGETCLGFNAEIMATKLKKSTPEVMAYNGSKRLAVRWESTRPNIERGATITDNFFFLFADGTQLCFPVNQAPISGSA